LQPENDRLGIGNLEWSHALMRSQFSTMRNYL
jgi:hypothetical protein